MRTAFALAAFSIAFTTSAAAAAQGFTGALLNEACNHVTDPRDAYVCISYIRGFNEG